ncbi:glycoside hydrolase family 16 protein [Zhouia amylolytica]|nr:glycoside hydrolase family 16 protein [Zhouia amylolytica]MCQ0112021.1 glycoside hydrolase family 16 protein [Zhouia amylolytica]
MENNKIRTVISNITIWMLFLGTAIACSKEQGSPTEEEVVYPTNLKVDISLAGQDDYHPYGDGTGVAIFNVSADNAIKYELTYNNTTIETNTEGYFEYQFKKEGLDEYKVEVIAYSETNHAAKQQETVTIHVNENGFSELVWSDDFDGGSGRLDASKWNYDLGDGCPSLCGWGNGEQQYYTDRSDNVKVEDGFLKITAKKETYEGKSYTSARIKTQGKFSFTYGKLEILAKLPNGGGTWPALWMLGENISSVGWPQCGEIDIMEHRGNYPGQVSCALHTESSYGNTNNKGEVKVDNVSGEFHLYAIEWTEEKIDFYVDNKLFYTYQPSTKTEASWPFNKNQFIILNIAMGGTLGGEIPSSFNEAEMVVDYVKLYQ